MSVPAVHEYGLYTLDTEVRAGHLLSVTGPFAISFDPASITDLE